MASNGNRQQAMKRAIEILHLEDNADDAELIHETLLNGGMQCELRRVQTRSEFRDALERHWDVILADYALPSFDGLEALKVSKERVPTTPFIFVTGAMGEDRAVETLKNGATDYVLKQRLERVVPALQRALRESEEQRKRSEAELALRRSEGRLLALLEGVRDYAIFMLDAAGNLATWSAVAETITGFGSSEALGKPFSTFLTSQALAADEAQQQLRMAASTGRAESEGWRVRKDGSEFWATVIVTALREEEGPFFGFAVVMQDVTERRTAALEREKMQHERTNLQEKFLSHVSHELRTPLNSICQFVEILLDGQAGEISAKPRQFLEIVRRNCEQLKTLLGDLFTLTRSGSGKLAVDPAPTSISEVINQVVASFRPEASGLAWVIDLAPGLPLVYADPNRAYEILSNLIDNAVKYTGEDRKITVGADIMEDQPGFVRVSVSNSGCGISPEHRARVFERFYQIPKDSETTRRGLGIGLYVCKELVTAHGGTIWVESETGKETSFCFTLPVFSLARMMEPLLSSLNIPTESMELITVRLSMAEAVSATEEQRCLRTVRKILKDCIRSGADVLLPRIHSGSREHKFCILASYARGDHESVVRRMREELSFVGSSVPLRGEVEVFATELGRLATGANSTRSPAEELAGQIEALVDGRVPAEDSIGPP